MAIVLVALKKVVQQKYKMKYNFFSNCFFRDVSVYGSLILVMLCVGKFIFYDKSSITFL